MCTEHLNIPEELQVTAPSQSRMPESLTFCKRIQAYTAMIAAIIAAIIADMIAAFAHLYELICFEPTARKLRFG